MISEELAKKIRYIQITTKKTVNSILAGEYESVFKGRGIEFSEVREYESGDEVRSIDWNVTARTGKLHVKRYVEEREQTVMFLVDMSASGTFGTVEKTKNEVAAELCALLAFSAVRNNDKVGLAVFTSEVELFIPPKKGQTHVLRIIREILAFSPKHPGTDIPHALDFLGRILRKRAVVFLLSDFLTGGFRKKLKIAAERNDLIALVLQDPMEIGLNNMGMVSFRDAESGEVRLVDTSSRRVREYYRDHTEMRMENLKKAFKSCGIDHVLIRVHEEYLQKLVAFFLAREKRLKRLQ